MQSSHALDRTEITLDDDRAVANAGLVMTATLADRLGIEAAIDALVDLGERPAAAHPGRKSSTDASVTAPSTARRSPGDRSRKPWLDM